MRSTFKPSLVGGGADQLAGIALEDMDRLEAVPTGMGVEQRQLLAAVHEVVAVEQDRGGRSLVAAAEEAGSPAERGRSLRQHMAKPRLDEFAVWLDAQLQKIPGRSDLAGAIRYARSRWDALSRYLDDGRLELSNNAAENAIRPVALGRKKLTHSVAA